MRVTFHNSRSYVSIADFESRVWKDNFEQVAGVSCSYNQRIKRLPDPLPPRLESLCCDHSGISEIPVLPATLRELGCSKTGITELPALPEGLERLICRHTKLTALPALPKSLKRIELNGSPVELTPEQVEQVQRIQGAQPSRREDSIALLQAAAAALAKGR